jgi:broad specificity phosphatase PhoE/ribonuclease HI
VTRFVVEADGGSRGNPGPASYGTVVKDFATGTVLREIAEHIGTASNNVAEYRGLIAGLEAVRELDPEATVEARLDSKLVVEQMSGRWKIKHPDMRDLALRARDVLPPSNVTYVWVPRERNKHADGLANEALDAAARGEPWSQADSTAELRAQDALLAADAAEAAESAEVTPRARLVGWDADLGAPTTTVLLRHGETVHTAEKRFSGAGGHDPELSDEGLRQAKAVAERLARDGGVDAVVSSPMRRTRQTADAVASALGLTVREVDDVRECAFGEWEGLTFDEVRTGWPEQLAAWMGDPAATPPGGESFEDVRRRVTRARDQLVARHPRKVVLLVTHVTPTKVLVADALDAPLSALYRMELSPATLTELQWYESGQASLRRFNDAAHLL